ncbi:hypothetical protein [Geminicoccus harenae]|uniref:hypothetical protein n=1 Tax=Geminicoccus harenae TaxID=2498453 RepID=UPI00168A53B9|nr:hypothetical protein [Geminicoccus harenae]
MTQQHPTDPVLGINLDAISSRPQMPLGTTAMGLAGQKHVYCFTAEEIEPGEKFVLGDGYTAEKDEEGPYEVPATVPAWSFFWGFEWIIPTDSPPPGFKFIAIGDGPYVLAVDGKPLVVEI